MRSDPSEQHLSIPSHGSIHRDWRRKSTEVERACSTSWIFSFPVMTISSLRGRRTGRWAVLPSSAIALSRLLKLDTTLLLTGWLLGTKVAVVLRVGRILRWGRLRVVIIRAVGLLILVRGRAGRRSHPSCASVRAETVVATATGVDASVSGVDVSKLELIIEVIARCDMGDGDLRKTEEEEESDADDDAKGYPATPAIPGRVAVVIVAAAAAGVSPDDGVQGGNREVVGLTDQSNLPVVSWNDRHIGFGEM